MAAIAERHRGPSGLLLPLALLAGLLILIAGQIDWSRMLAISAALSPPETTIVATRPYAYREPGDFHLGTSQIDGPLAVVAMPPPLEIMTYQVSASDYDRCVADTACRAAAPRRRGSGHVPVTGVSFDDAEDYATWLSNRTGDTWRLPTIGEWSFAAGERAVDPALELETETGDPTERWIALYEREAELGAGALSTPEPLGGFGFNAFGVADIAGSVWEWTATCASRTTLDQNGQVLTVLPSCGVRYVEGRHRAQISTFVRDARAGGCSTGTPPDNLGFRLVRERSWPTRLLDAFRAWVGPAPTGSPGAL